MLHFPLCRSFPSILNCLQTSFVEGTEKYTRFISSSQRDVARAGVRSLPRRPTYAVYKLIPDAPNKLILCVVVYLFDLGLGPWTQRSPALGHPKLLCCPGSIVQNVRLLC